MAVYSLERSYSWPPPSLSLLYFPTLNLSRLLHLGTDRTENTVHCCSSTVAAGTCLFAKPLLSNGCCIFTLPSLPSNGSTCHNIKIVERKIFDYIPLKQHPHSFIRLGPICTTVPNNIFVHNPLPYISGSPTFLKRKSILKYIFY
jgi:hypothetical protein